MTTMPDQGEIPTRDAAPKPRLGNPVRILIVDDERDLIDYLTVLLSREGFQITGLTEPQKVVDELKAHEYHLVVLDMMMPSMSGTEVLEQIRKVDTDIAVIVSTAYPNVDTAIASLKHQASDYVRKPFEPEAFLATVRAALARKGLSVDPEIELYRTIGKVIHQARSSQGLTLKQLARRTGLSMSLLSQIERAESSPSIGSLFRIASALGLKMADLFGDH
jgi:DNA-binding response OmpR family regulator